MSQAVVPSGSAGPVSMMGTLVSQLDPNDASYRIITLPTGTAAGRTFMQRLCINADEVRVAAMPSHDIRLRCLAADDPHLVIARIVRREGYFRAVLVQSRGTLRTGCAHRCDRSTVAKNSHPFFECRTVAGFQAGSNGNGACGSCVWQSHGARCQHRS